jgi:hypothetical protein
MSDHKGNPRAFGTQVKALPRTRDAYGRVLEPGDEIIVPKLSPVRFLVRDVAPEMRMGFPPNLVRIALVATVEFHAPADTAVVDLIRIRTAAEQGLGRANTTADAPRNGGPEPGSEPEPESGPES